MGSYSSLFEKNEEQSKVVLQPNKADFIINCADLTGLAVVEVQRFWTRFKQLGCDKNANLPKKVLEKGELSQDAFVKNIISNLPKERDESLNFLVFLKFFYWLESANEEEKLRVLFNFLNNGDDLDYDILYKLLKRLYTPSSDEQLKLTSQLLLSQLDINNTGRISENQFLNAIRRNYSINELNKFLKIDIIPNEVLDEANMQQSLNGSVMSVRNNKNLDLTIELTDALLDQVASRAVKKNWEKLAIDLGFLESDIKAYLQKHKSNKFEALLDILIEWRDQDPYLATKNRLRRYLENCQMTEAAALLR